MKSSSSIGIIGGADGPTAIFVSYKLPDILWTIAGIAAVILVIIGIILWFRHRK